MWKIYKNLITSEQEINKKFREYQKYNWKDELYFITNLIIQFDEKTHFVKWKVLKNIVYDQDWYIYDIFFSWDIFSCFEGFNKKNNKEFDEATKDVEQYFNEYNIKIQSLLKVYNIKEENILSISVSNALFDELENINNKLFVVFLSNNLSDYKLLPKELINNKKDFLWKFNVNSILSLYNNSHTYSEINFLKDSDKIIDEIFENTNEEEIKEKWFNLTKLISTFDLKLRVWTKNELIKMWDVDKKIFDEFLKDDLLTDKNDLYWILYSKIPNEFVKENWKIKNQWDWYLYLIKVFHYNNFEHFKTKIKEMFINMWIENKDSLYLDWSEVDLKEWFFISDKFLNN